MQTKDLLHTEIQHIDIKSFDATPLLKQFELMAFQARNLARASLIYVQMLKDSQCAVILCLAGSLISAGLRTENACAAPE